MSSRECLPNPHIGQPVTSRRLEPEEAAPPVPENRLQVRRRGGRKRAFGTRAPMVLPDGPNQRWSLDFVSDAVEDSQRFRILCVAEDLTRVCIGLVSAA